LQNFIELYCQQSCAVGGYGGTNTCTCTVRVVYQTEWGVAHISTSKEFSNNLKALKQETLNWRVFKINTHIQLCCGRLSGLLVHALIIDLGQSSPGQGLTPGQGYCIVFFSKCYSTFHGLANAEGNPVMDKHLSRGDYKCYKTHYVLMETLLVCINPLTCCVLSWRVATLCWTSPDQQYTVLSLSKIKIAQNCHDLQKNHQWFCVHKNTWNLWPFATGRHSSETLPWKCELSTCLAADEGWSVKLMQICHLLHHVKSW